MNKITEFFKSNKYAIIWTVAYIAIVWLILIFLFNFNMFSGHQWQMLARAQLNGFGGFVFGILILAAVPLYVATTVLIVRTQQPIITINTSYITKIFNAIYPRPAPPTTTPEISEEPAPTTIATPDLNEFPHSMPKELRSAFIRARQHINQFNASAFNVPQQQSPAPESVPDAEVGELPLPTDFDFDEDDTSTSDVMPILDAPTFTEIDFGDNDNAEHTEITPSPETDTPATTSTAQDIIQYLNAQGNITTIKGDMILTDGFIIAIHDDPDFWIADPENWFAAGKQKPSPIIELIKESATTGLKPVIYLAQTNIMDLDRVRQDWSNMGVTCITDITELPIQ